MSGLHINPSPALRAATLTPPAPEPSGAISSAVVSLAFAGRQLRKRLSIR